MLTNRFEVTFDYENINRDFGIYAVTKESKKLYKSNILDLPRAQFQARAVQYLWGATALVLFDKNTVQESVFRTTLQEKYPDAKVMRIDVLNEAERQKWFKKDNYLLLNLLINTLKSPKNQLFCYNNLTGALYYRRSEWKWKNYIWFLNIHFDYGMLLQLSVTTFMKAVKNGNYLFDENTGSFRKRLSDDDCHGELYSKHSYLKKHNTVDFIRYRDFQEFCKSKLGVMEQFLRDVKEKLGNYLTLQAALPGETTIVKPKKQNNSENNIKRLLADYSLNISDCVDSELSKDVIVQLVHRFWETYHVEVQIGNLQKGMLNLRIIHNENYYGDHEELHDPHEDDVSGYIVQHVTVEDFVSKKTGEISKHGFEKILQELLIKADNQQKKMRAFAWNELKLSNTYSFVTRRSDKDDEGNKVYVYYQVKVQPDGSLGYKCFNEKDDVLIFRHLEFGTRDYSITCEIASHQDAFRMTTAVIGIAWYDVLGHDAHEKIAYNAGGLFRLAGNLESHRAMNTQCPCGSNGIKQYRDIAMSDEPFGMLSELLQGNAVQQVNRAIAQKKTKNSFDAVIF